MVQLAGALNGLLNAFQNMLNGGLGGVYGPFVGSVIVHLAGLSILLILLALGKIRPTGKGHWLMYFGGMVGMVNVACIGIAVEKVGVTVHLCLCLLGQMCAGALIDQKGLLWMKKAPMNKTKAMGLVFIAVGAGVMLLW